jgi:hypothetical protein
MKSTLFWNVTPCSLVGLHRRFGGTSVSFFQTMWRNNGKVSTINYILHKTYVPCISGIRSIRDISSVKHKLRCVTVWPLI